MARFNPEDLRIWTRGKWLSGEMPETIPGFCFDARLLNQNECFVALTCGVRDGHAFAGQALDAGASSLIAERPLELSLPQLIVEDSLVAMGAIATEVRKQFSAPVIGITGSCGKTSTKEMLRILLGQKRTYATPGNMNNRIGVPMTLFGLDAKEHEFAVIEAGINQPGEMAALGSMIQADLSIITNIESVHLELLGSVDNIAAEKAFLVLNSNVDAPVVLPNSVLKYAAFSKHAERAWALAAEGESLFARPERVIRYGLEVTGSGYSALSLNEDSNLQTFHIASPSKGICLNAALAIIVAREFGISDAEIDKRLREWTPASKRGRIEQHGDQTFYIDCYNANPASMGDALDAFCRAAPSDRPRCYVLGAMNELGVEAIEFHRKIGQSLCLRSQDQAFFIGPDSLTQAYCEGILEGGSSLSQVRSAEDVNQIKSMIADFSGVVFLKGSRSYQLEGVLPEKEH